MNKSCALSLFKIARGTALYGDDRGQIHLNNTSLRGKQNHPTVFVELHPSRGGRSRAILALRDIRTSLYSRRGDKNSQVVRYRATIPAEMVARTTKCLLELNFGACRLELFLHLFGI